MQFPDTDLCAAALLNDLVTLDDTSAPAQRRSLLLSAIETASWLIAQGGGPFELDAIQQIQAELTQELSR